MFFKVEKKTVHGSSHTITLTAQANIKAGQYVKIPMPNQPYPLYLALASGQGDQSLKFSQTATQGKTSLLSLFSVGSEIEIEGPEGDGFQPKNKKVLLICAGSAETVMRNMLRTFKAQGLEVEVIYTAKDIADVPFPKLLYKLQKDPKHHIAFTGGSNTNFNHGRITDGHLSSRSIAPDTDVFICGPVSFENAVINQLLEKGHDPANIYFNHWGKIEAIPNMPSEVIEKRQLAHSKVEGLILKTF